MEKYSPKETSPKCRAGTLKWKVGPMTQPLEGGVKSRGWGENRVSTGSQYGIGERVSTKNHNWHSINDRIEILEKMQEMMVYHSGS